MVSRFPAGLGTDELRRQENKVKVIPGYMYRSGWHISFHLSIPTSAAGCQSQCVYILPHFFLLNVYTVCRK